MKDTNHHLKFVQRKVVQSVRRESSREELNSHSIINNHNSQHKTHSNSQGNFARDRGLAL